GVAALSATWRHAMGVRATSVRTVRAEDYERLQRDLAAQNDQVEAAIEVLSSIGRSAGDADTVLTTIVESARRLCRSEAALLYVLEHGVYRVINTVGLSEGFAEYLAGHPIPLDRRTLVGRVGLDRRPLQIADVLTDPDFGRHDLQRAAGFRTTMGAPMLLDDEAVGALN